MTPEAETILLNKINAVLGDLHDVGASDGEAMFMLGAAADYVCQTGEAATWPALKAKLSPTETLGLLAQIDQEGQAATADGKIKLAYALQIIGLSVAASGATNPQIGAATNLLDGPIVAALANYRRHAKARAQ